MRKKNTPRISNGHDQLCDFLSELGAREVDAKDRHAAVTNRITELEAELAALKDLQHRISAALG